MKILVSGATGLVGRYVVNGLLDAGHAVIAGGRTPPQEGWFTGPVGFVPLSLDPDAEQSAAFRETDAFVHAAFDHLPGRYRGGEGEDPARFRRLNLDGTTRLFETARRAGVRRTIFLSSRAVYDGLTPSTPLLEDAALRPASLYGEMKLLAEQALCALSSPGFVTASLRLTGVYGDLRPNKWDRLFTDYLEGRPVPNRAGTEVHGRDVVSAIHLMLAADAADIDGRAFNVSDIVTDNAAILAELQEATGCPHALPPQAGRDTTRAMPTDRIRQLGWQPGGRPLLRQTVRRLAEAYR